MIEESGIKLASLFPQGVALDEDAQAAISADPEAGAGNLPWHLICRPAEAKLRGLLECDLFELIGQAWTTTRALQAFADEAQYSFDKTWTVPLAEHSFEQEVHPVLQVTVAPLATVSLRFTIVLCAHVKGLALNIRGGRILGGTLGEASVSAELKYKSVSLTGERESEPLRLPVSFALAAPGLRIPPP